MPNETLVTYVLLILSALAAGAVNSIAGGGTLLTFPALLRILGSVEANATSTIALLPGSLAGALGYRKELRQSKRLILILLAPSIIGGVAGALLVTRFPEKVFSQLVPWLILTASVLFLVQAPLKKLTKAGQQGPATGWTVVVVIFGQLLIAIYGGYFGAGIGILMLSVLPFMGTRNIHETNGAKTFLASIINAVTVVIFIAEGKVVWKYALVMAVSAIIGGYVGARFARRLPAVYVRAIVITIGLSLGLYYLWLQLFSPTPEPIPEPIPES